MCTYYTWFTVIPNTFSQLINRCFYRYANCLSAAGESFPTSREKERSNRRPVVQKKPRSLRDLPISPGIRRPFEWDDETGDASVLCRSFSRVENTQRASAADAIRQLGDFKLLVGYYLMRYEWFMYTTITASATWPVFLKNRRFSSHGVPFPPSTFTTRSV